MGLTATCRQMNALSTGTKSERSTMSLAHSTRCRPGLTHAGNTPLQLLRCSSGQGAGPRVSSGMSLHVSG